MGSIKHIGLKPLFLANGSYLLLHRNKNYFKNLVSLKLCSPPFKQEPVQANPQKSRFLLAGFRCMAVVFTIQ